MSTNPFEGRNPFDDLVNWGVPAPQKPTGNSRLDKVMARMEHAAQQAERQRSLAQDLRNKRPQEAPAPLPEVSPPAVPVTPRKVWGYFCLGVWGLLSLAALSQGLIGGIMVSFVLLLICLACIQLPVMFMSIFSSNARSSNGNAV